MLHLHSLHPVRTLLALASAALVTLTAAAQLSPLHFGGKVTGIDDPSGLFDSVSLGDPFTASYSFVGLTSLTLFDDSGAYWRSVRPTFEPGTSANLTIGEQSFESIDWIAQIYDSHEDSVPDAVRIYADDFISHHDFGLSWGVELVGPHDLFPAGAASGDWMSLLSLEGYSSMTAFLRASPKIWFTPEFWFVDGGQSLARIDATIDARQVGPGFVPVPEPSTYGVIGVLLLTATILLRRRP